MSVIFHLPLTAKDKPVVCGACSAEALLEVKDSKIKWCAACGYHRPPLLLPQPAVFPQIPPAWQTWLVEMGLRFPLLSSPWEIGVGLFYMNKRWKKRLLLSQMEDGVVKQIIGIDQDGVFNGLPMVHRGLSTNKKNSEIFVVGHPLDALYLRQLGFENVLCPSSLLSDQKSLDGFLQAHETELGAAESVVLALPNYKELGRRIGVDKSKYLTGLNLEQLSQGLPWLLELAKSGEEEKIRAALNDPMSFPIDGVHSLYDVESEYDRMYEEGLKPGLSTGWPNVDEHYTVALGQWTLLTGIPGHGKSTWLDGLLVNLASNHDWRAGIFSPENRPIERHFAILTEKLVKATFLPGYANRMTESEKEAAKPWIADRFKAIMPDEDQSWSLEGILNLAKQAIFRYGLKAIVIDPWNELDHSRPAGLTEPEYLSKCLSMVNRFCLRYMVHVFIVAHPTKLQKDADGKYPVPTLYDVNGGAMWRNKTYNGLVIWRNFGCIDEDVWDIHVQKIKFKEIGKPGLVSLRADSLTGVAYDEIDPVKRKQALESPVPIPTSKQLRANYDNMKNSFVPPMVDKHILD